MDPYGRNLGFLDWGGGGFVAVLQKVKVKVKRCQFEVYKWLRVLAGHCLISHFSRAWKYHKSLQENLKKHVTDGICYSLNVFLDNEVTL
jgi:hypothetical protein